MSASAVGDAGPSMAKTDSQTPAQRPEVAAVLLQRLDHALNAGEQARVGGLRSQVRMHSSDSDGTAIRVTNEQAFGALGCLATHPATEQPAASTAARQTMQSALADELLGLMQQLCSAVYVGDRSSSQQRVLLTLEGALHGAAAELVRDGAHLTIRLHAGNELTYRMLLTQRQTLEQMLYEHELPQAAVEIVPVGGLGHARHE